MFEDCPHYMKMPEKGKRIVIVFTFVWNIKLKIIC
jgi:hypothetical protein